MDADNKIDKSKSKQSKILWKTKPKSISEKSEQSNNTIQDKINSIEDKENEVDMEVSSQMKAKDEEASESYYSKENAEPTTKTDVHVFVFFKKHVFQGRLNVSQNIFNLSLKCFLNVSHKFWFISSPKNGYLQCA